MPLDKDVSLESAAPVKSVAVGSLPVTGSIRNQGGETITSVTVEYRLDGGLIRCHTFTGLNQVPLTTWTFRHPIPLIIPGSGAHTLEVWTSQPNGDMDKYPFNDTIVQHLNALAYIPPQHILVEEFTGTWCCPCADGIEYLGSLEVMYPQAVIAAIHNGSVDPMTTPEGTSMRITFTGAYPTATFNRIKFPGQYYEGMSRGYWFTNSPKPWI